VSELGAGGGRNGQATAAHRDPGAATTDALAVVATDLVRVNAHLTAGPAT
jgi:hypothetical protein